MLILDVNPNHQGPLKIKVKVKKHFITYSIIFIIHYIYLHKNFLQFPTNELIMQNH